MSVYHRAFTLLEVVVTLFVIFILVIITIPAVQNARETARAAQCISNLKQIGISMHSYYSTHQMFPPSQLLTIKTFANNHISELTYLLPNLEKNDLYNSINMNFSSLEWSDAPSMENRTARSTMVAAFLCPSDTNPLLRNSYRFNRGRLGVTKPFFDGPFSVGIFPSEATISDGLTRTAFVSERVSGSFTNGSENRKLDIKIPVFGNYHFKSDTQFIPFCLQAAVYKWDNGAGRFWLYSDFKHMHYNHNGSPNDKSPTCSNPVDYDNGFGLHPPRSFHNSYVNVLFGDGHVETASDSINPAVWSSLGTHAARD